MQAFMNIAGIKNARKTLNVINETPTSEITLFSLHEGLDRLGPGDPKSTRHAWGLLDGLPSDPLILDIGCGCGAQTLDIVPACGGRCVAVDIHPGFLGELAEKAARAGIGENRLWLNEAASRSRDGLSFPRIRGGGIILR